MSHQGRCSTTQANVLLLFLFLTIVSAQKTTFTVGDKYGWTFNVENWTDGKKFKASDELGNTSYNIHYTIFSLAICGVLIRFTHGQLIFVQFSTMIHPSTMWQLLMPMNIVVVVLLQALGHSPLAKIPSNYRRDSTTLSAPSLATAMLV